MISCIGPKSFAPRERLAGTAHVRAVFSHSAYSRGEEMENNNICRAWAEGDSILEEYHDHEWCRICHDDHFQFEMLCLEGASVGLSWKTVMHKREAYRVAFHGFDIEACAAMTDAMMAMIIIWAWGMK